MPHNKGVPPPYQRIEPPAVEDVKGMTRNTDFFLERGRLEGAGPFSGRIRRGWLMSKFPDENGYLHMLQFLFNPSVLSFSYNLDTNDIYALQDMTAAEASGNSRVEHRTVNLALLFDRTLEVGNSGSDRGVEVDMQQLHRLIGIEEIRNDIPLAMKPVIMRISPNANSILNLHGWITSVEMSFTHFSYDMRPTRAVANIGLTQVVDDAGGSAGGGSTTTVPNGGSIGQLEGRGDEDSYRTM